MRRALPIRFALLLVSCGAVVARAATTESPDPRLDRKVTYQASSAALAHVAADLSKMSGVEIRVGAGDRDWRVRERKVHVAFKDVPLGVALAELSKTLDYQLRRSGEEGA